MSNWRWPHIKDTMHKLFSDEEIILAVYRAFRKGLPDYVWDHFAETVPMSTYLVAFAVTDFEKITSGNFTVWARRNAIAQAQYSLDIGPKLLRFFENFFDIKFPLPKIDMVALPDFSAGAMENWGLITFR